ncbi:hypothetical protein [Halococcus sp. IIIV-5B]|uniref:hypothetical protein n=1 Tax=Halococcus sp. IIIV-5B TaxID=2321230 RepID=UPI0011C37312|nr:hypothetical protein [Halococcus sp. IIIV-5B]
MAEAPLNRSNLAVSSNDPKDPDTLPRPMAIIEDIRESLSPASTDDETTRYRCVDCLTEFDEQKQICPKCGGAEFDRL